MERAAAGEVVDLSECDIPDVIMIRLPRRLNVKKKTNITLDGRFFHAAGNLLVYSCSPYQIFRSCLDGTKLFSWACKVRARILSEVAYISTLGGGFASVRNVKKAIEYAVKLFYCACLLSDEDMKSKSRLFVGYNLMWMGNKQLAKIIFSAEVSHAASNHNEVAVNRGLGALYQLTHNPSYLDKGGVIPEESTGWNTVFTESVEKDARIRDGAAEMGFQMAHLK